MGGGMFDGRQPYQVKYGDEVVYLDDEVGWNKAYRYLEKGKTYKVGYIIMDGAFSIQGINPLYGLFKKISFKKVEDIQKQKNKERLKKVKLLQKPSWYRWLHEKLR